MCTRLCKLSNTHIYTGNCVVVTAEGGNEIKTNIELCNQKDFSDKEKLNAKHLREHCLFACKLMGCARMYTLLCQIYVHFGEHTFILTT